MTKHYDIGDIVNLARRGDCAIASKRYIRRGRYAGKAEYTLGSLRPEGFPGKTYAVVCKGESLFREAKGTYTEEQIKVAIDRVHGTSQEVRERKEARAEEGRKALGDQEWIPGKGVVGTDIAPGDTVLFQYRGGVRREEVVAKVNFATGKIAVVKPGYAKGYRWLHASGVVEVKTATKKLPCSISEATFGRLHENGWAQVRLGREFIERSYTVAFTRDLARTQGNNWDCSSTVVYFDSDLNVFWRYTGSFD